MQKIKLQIKVLSLLVGCVLVLAVLVGCTKEAVAYRDGSYEATSAKTDERGGFGKISLNVSQGKITGVEFHTYNKDGSVKDETYGEGLPEGQYKIAQAAIAANAEYAKQLVEYQQLIDVDAVSGATWNYQLFEDAAQQVLEQAQQSAGDKK